MTCLQCGTANPPHAKFCLECAAPLAERPVAREVRKRVTVVFCDVTSSTALGESVDPEALRGILGRYYERMRAIVERHGGTVEKFIGDAVMAVFGVPVLHEDDAVRALRAAAEMRAALPELGIQARIGVNTGEVVSGSGDSLVTGDAVNVAARLEQAAPPGEVYVGGETIRLARGVVEFDPVEPLALKGKAEPVEAFRLVAVASGDRPRDERGSFVGRRREQLLLQQAFDLAVSDRICQLFTLLGVAGVGKSRLASRFLARVDAHVVRGRCLSYGEGITYWPVVEVVKQLHPESRQLDRRVAEPLAALLGGGGAVSKDEIGFAVRRLFEEAAGERPLVVVWDDLHWAEEAFLDLVEHVADWSRGAPILVLCMARPELLDRRAGWSGGKLHAATVLLEPLGRAESEELLADLAGDVDAALRERILGAAEGNPLYVEEMVAMLEAATGEEVAVPPTIQALLAARLDQLPEPERAALERGAVEGQVFHRSAVEALAPSGMQLAAQLQGLVRKELVRPEQALLPDDDAFRFRHILIRDAAYDALPKATRADLHERFALWLLERAPDLVELDEIAGYHLEQASLYLRELGLDASRAGVLAGRGAARLRAAGLAALTREDARAAATLLGRAAALLDDDSPERGPLLAQVAEALLEADEIQRAVEVAGQVRRLADERSSRFARLIELRVAMMADSTSDERAVLAELDQLLQVVPGDDDELLARIWELHGLTAFFLGRTDDAIESARRGAAAAVRCGNGRVERRTLGSRIAAETHGSTPVPEAIRSSDEILANLSHPLTRSFVCQKRARLETLAGNYDAARAFYAEAKQLAIDYGFRLRRGVQTQDGAELELAAGDPEAAERELRDGYAVLAELGETGFRSTVASLLAEALLAQGRIDEALVAAADALTLAAPDDADPIARVKTIRAVVAAERGALTEAMSLANEALELVEATDWLERQGNAYLALARVHARSGHSRAAAAAAATAKERYAAKGDVPGVASARAFAEELRDGSLRAAHPGHTDEA
jgi:class 3 adenylate cyclase